MKHRLKEQGLEMGPKNKFEIVQLLCCLWKARLPHRRQRVWDLVCRLLLVGDLDRKHAERE